jgi:hypothetical protein
MLTEIAHQNTLDQGLGAALQIPAKRHQAGTFADGKETLDDVGHGHLAEGLEGIVAGFARDQGRHPARHLGGAVEAVQRVDAGGLPGEGWVEVYEAFRSIDRPAGTRGGIAQVLVALGVDDDHRLAAQHRLGDQQVEEARLPLLEVNPDLATALDEGIACSLPRGCDLQGPLAHRRAVRNRGQRGQVVHPRPPGWQPLPGCLQGRHLHAQLFVCERLSSLPRTGRRSDQGGQEHSRQGLPGPERR